MNYVEKLMDGVQHLFHLNKATLSGAIDIVVVQHPDGEFRTTPFHVRFGKLQLLSSNEKVVKILINGEETDLQMKLGTAGEAFFVAAAPPSSVLPGAIPEEYATSPIVSPPHSPIPGERSGGSPTKARRRKLPLSPDGGATLSDGAEYDGVDVIDENLDENNDTYDVEWGWGGLPGVNRHKPSGEEVSTAGVAAAADEAASSGDAALADLYASLNQEAGASDTAGVEGAEVEKAWSVVSNDGSDDSDSDGVAVTGRASSAQRGQQDAAAPVGSWTGRAVSFLTGRNGNIPHIDAGTSGRPQAVTPAALMARSVDGDGQMIGPDERARLSKSWSDADLRPSAAAASDLSFQKKALTNSTERPAPSSSVLAVDTAPPPQPTEEEQASYNEYAIGDLQGLNRIEMSICGHILLSPDYRGTAEEARELFDDYKLTFEDVTDNVEVIADPSVVFRINGRLFDRTAGNAMLLSLLAFNKSLPAHTVTRKVLMEEEKKRRKSKSKSSPSAEKALSGAGNAGDAGALDSPVIVPKHSAEWNRYVWEAPKSSESAALGTGGVRHTFHVGDFEEFIPTAPVSAASNDADEQDEANNGAAGERADTNSTSQPSTVISRTGSTADATTADGGDGGTDVDNQMPTTKDSTGELSIRKRRGPKYVKMLRPTSEQIRRLKLKMGPNQITFQVNSRMQGTKEVQATIYLWPDDAKIVISDIDGTITKSDVFGNVLPVLGFDWSHSGVAKLYSSIESHGYKMLYLTARAIGQANTTRGYVENLQQGEDTLPRGPILMSPDRLLTSFNREVITRTADTFKIACLNDIRSLFTSANPDPYYVGFGNRDKDAVSYRAVGIPDAKIFLISPNGRMKHAANSAYDKTHAEMDEIIELMFPPAGSTTDERYNDLNYWDIY